MILAVLVGLSAAGCAPSLEGAGERGGTIREYQLQQNEVELGPLPVPLGAVDSNVLSIAGKYCSQYGRSAHIAHEEVSLLWTNTFTFDCVE